MFRACQEHDDHTEDMDTSAQVNHIRVDTDGDEALVSIMDQLAISDFDPVDTKEDAD